MEQNNSFNSDFSTLSEAGMSGISQDSLKLESLIGLTREQLEELRKLNNSPRAQSQMSSYSMYTDQAHNVVSANGIYMPSGTSFTNGLMDRYKGSNASGIVGGMILDRQRVGMAEREKMAQQSGAGITNAGISGIGTGIGVASSFAAYAMFPGLLAPMAIGAGAGMIAEKSVSSTINRVKAHQSYNDYMLNESYRFINRYESNNQRTGVGFSRDEMHNSATFLREVGTDKSMGDNEISMLLSKFTESGMMRSTSDLDSFKNKMSKLTDIVKQSALMLNESYEDVADMLGELERKGISTGNLDNILGKMKGLGGYTGKSGTEMFQQISAGVDQRVYGTAADALIQYDSLSISRMGLAHIYDTAGKDTSDPTNQRIRNIVKNSGGEEVVASYMAQGLRNMSQQHLSDAMRWAFDYDESSGSFKYNADRARDVLSNKNLTTQDLSGMSVNKMHEWTSKYGDGIILEWQSKNNEAFLNAGDLAGYRMMDSFAEAFAKETGLTKEQSMYQLSREAFGGNNEMMEIMAKHHMPNMINNGDFYKASLDRDALLQIAQSTHDANNLGPIGAIKKGARRVGDFVASPFVKMSDSISDKMVEISDWMYGRTNMYQNKYDSINVDLHSQNIIDVVNGSDGDIEKLQNSLSEYLENPIDMSFSEKYTNSPNLMGVKTSKRATDYKGMKKQYDEFSEYVTNSFSNFFKNESYSGVSQGLKNTASEIFRDLKSGAITYEQAEKALGELGSRFTGSQERDMIDATQDFIKTESQFKEGLDIYSSIEDIKSGNSGLVGNFARAAIMIGEVGDKKLKKELKNIAGSEDLDLSPSSSWLVPNRTTLKQIAEDPSKVGSLSMKERERVISSTNKSLVSFMNRYNDDELMEMMSRSIGKDSAESVLKHSSSSDRANEMLNIIMNTPQDPEKDSSKEGSSIEGIVGRSIDGGKELIAAVKENMDVNNEMMALYEKDSRDKKDFILKYMNNYMA